MRTLSAKVRELADRQAGRVSAVQFAALGVESVTIARWVESGYVHQVLPRVYAVGHRAPSVEADLWTAVLYAGPGAMLSHATALWWRGLLDKQPRPIQVTTLRRCQSQGGSACTAGAAARRTAQRPSNDQRRAGPARLRGDRAHRKGQIRPRQRRLPQGARRHRTPGDRRCRP